jgi:hypothetical protein
MNSDLGKALADASQKIQGPRGPVRSRRRANPFWIGYALGGVVGVLAGALALPVGRAVRLAWAASSGITETNGVLHLTTVTNVPVAEWERLTQRHAATGLHRYEVVLNGQGQFLAREFDGGAIVDWEADCDLTNLVATLATNGTVCRVRGHKWGHVGNTTREPFTAFYRCLVCEKVERTTFTERLDFLNPPQPKP